MRIISDFHDYYDIGLSYGIDPKIIYKRKTKTVTLERDNISKYDRNKTTEVFEVAKTVFSGINGLGISLFVPRPHYNRYYLKINSLGCICFCGYIYPFIETRIERPNKFPEYQYIYTLREMDELIDNSNSKKIKQEYYKKNGIYRINTQYNFNQFFNESNKMLYNDLVDLHREYDSPIFIYEQIYNFKMIINPKLTDYKFYQIQDAYTTFQNLSMFMSGILGCKENEIININDKDLKHMKGFDEKSFRKEPTKKRKVKK